MKHVIVTGGTGFVGSYLCESFLEKGYAVTALDNFITGRKQNIVGALRNPNFHFAECDVSKPLPDDLPFLEKYGLAGVLHFACPASPVDFEKIPFEIMSVESLGTMNTVDLALRYHARYILASTSEVYGDPFEHPQKETYFGNVNVNGPRSCYDEAKRFSEAYVTTATRGQGNYKGRPYRPLNGGIVRIFNTYGPRMRPDDGRVVPEFCMQALEGRDITICGDGKQTRSFCYVTDLVDGIVKLYESEVQDPVNIGNPIERTIREFAEVTLKLANGKSKIILLDARQDDPRKRCPDITRATTLLGWSPKVSLEDGLAKTIEYFKKYSQNADRTRT